MLGARAVISSLRSSPATASLRCAAQPNAKALLFGGLQRRCLSSGPGGRFQKTKKSRVEVLEREAETPAQQQSSSFGFGQQQQQYQQGQQQQFGGAPSAFPSYAGPARDREKEQQQQGSQWDALGTGVVEHMRKVYGTLAVGIGIAAGASMFTMATPLLGVHPLVPGIGAMIPLMGIMYTSNHTMSPALRTALFAAFTALSGMSLAPMMYMMLKVSPAIVPQALLITTGLFGTMTALSLFAKPGSMLRLGVPLGAGMLMLMGCGIATMFVPVTSAFYPLLHNVYLYGGLGLFTLYIAYDTQNMIDEYEMGVDDHIKHATDLFLDFKIVFTKVMQILYFSRDD